jgi:hypothetical protein
LIDVRGQIEAPDRTQPGLPIEPCEWATPDPPLYKRHGAPTLSAAFDVLDGMIFGRPMQQHRHQEFFRFLNATENEFLSGRLLSGIVETYGKHKHPNRQGRAPNSS